ncbi:MAG TPA: iron ABC transporter permease [Anaerolineales bacterium]|nr:iron ABC transporter permease [Anaerolineales bacterium]
MSDSTHESLAKGLGNLSASELGRAFLTSLLWLVPLTFLAVFYFYPLGNILSIGFSRGERLAGTFLQAITSETARRVLWFTIWQATVSTLLTLLVGLPGAFLLARYDFRGKPLIRALTGIPFVMPTLVVAVAFNALLGPRGWFNLALMSLLKLSSPPIQFTNTLIAIFVAHVFYNTTIVLRMVGDFWSHLNPRLVYAARSLGANRWRTFRQVTLPLLMPAIAAAALLVFIFDFTSFGVILVLGGPRFATLEVEIYYQTISLFNLPMAAVLSVLQLACTLGLTVFYTRLSARVTRPISLRSRVITQKPLVTQRSKLLAAVIILFLLTLLTLPLLALATRSFTSVGAASGQAGTGSPQLTLQFYRELGVNRQESVFYVPPSTAIAVSLVYAIITVVFALALGLPASWLLAQGNETFLSRSLDTLLMLPLGTSAVTLGLGFIVALDHPPVDLRASPILVPIAHTLVALPFVVRSLAPALRSVQPRLRQAASTLGASPIRVLRYIDLPLVGRAILVAATFAFSISLGEFGATALLARPEYPTIPVAIYRYISRPGSLNYGQALALSTILMVVTAAGMLAIERFRIADVGEF